MRRASGIDPEITVGSMEGAPYSCIMRGMQAAHAYRQTGQSARREIVFRTLLTSLVVVFALGVGTFFLCRRQVSARLDEARGDSSEVLALQEKAVQLTLAGIGEITLLLAGQGELTQYLATGNSTLLPKVASEYELVARTFGDFNQIRFLDMTGMEVIRVNYDGEVAEIVPADRLQDKSNRYYFRKAIPLGPDEIYVSALDLNVEQGEIEIPYKPMLRFSTCAYDREANKRGVIVVNYLAANLLRLLDEERADGRLQTLLANSDGYWLKGPSQDDEWGFLLGDRQDATLANTYPDAAERIYAAASGQFQVPSGLFTFVTLEPARLSQASAMQDVSPSYAAQDWKLISFVSSETLASVLRPIRSMWLVIFGAGSVVGVALSWIYARIRTLQLSARRQVNFLATRDALTGIYNRHFFERRAEEEVERGIRYKHPIAFLVIDVTRFKQINDAYGHATGDQVLQEVASILQASVRSIDTVVRSGGDEFLVMFPETPNEAAGARVRIEAALADINQSSRFPFPIAVALGTAVWRPDAPETIDDVLRRADERMYEHKRTQHPSS